MVEVAFFADDFHMFLGGCTGHPALSRQAGMPLEALERLLVSAAALGLEGALQVPTLLNNPFDAQPCSFLASPMMDTETQATAW